MIFCKSKYILFNFCYKKIIIREIHRVNEEVKLQTKRESVQIEKKENDRYVSTFYIQINILFITPKCIL